MNEQVLTAISQAKWNESVTIEHHSESSSSSSSMVLVPTLDKDNGGIKWEGYRTEMNNDDDKNNEQKQQKEGIISKTHARSIHLHTKKWIFPMLNDQRRNELYDRAIQRASLEVARRFPNTGAVTAIATLDIGSGTGLLAMLSKKHLVTAMEPADRSKIHVASLEMAGPMAELAKATVQLEQTTNSRDATIEVIEGHSCKIPPIKSTTDGDKQQQQQQQQQGAVLCTSELLESGLLAEGWLPAMRDAWERHLHPRAVVVPQRARIVAQLVEGASGFCGPHQSLPMVTTRTKEASKESIPSLRLFTTAPSNEPECECGVGSLSDGSYNPLTGQKHGIQVEIHADRYLASENGDHPPILKTLSEPITALHLDVSTPESIPKSDADTIPSPTKFVAKESGRADGILFWWELDLYEGDDMTYSTKPGSGFQDHWHQCLYVFPPFSEHGGCGIELKKHQEYTLFTSHTDSRVHFSVSDSSNDSAGTKMKHSQEQEQRVSQATPTTVGPFRCWQLNDLSRSTKFRDGIRYALDSLIAVEVGKSTATATVSTTFGNVLDISDFSLCGMMASLLGAKMVTSVESSSSGLALETARVAQIGNGLPRDENNTIFQIVQCHAESLTRDVVLHPDEKEQQNKKRKRMDGEITPEEKSVVGEGIVDLIVGEPYYEMLEGWPIETALNYFYTIRMLKRKGIVKRTALCVPARAVVLACGIECFDLGKAYNPNLSSKSKVGDKSSKNVLGFDHSPVAECWNYDRKGISLPLWEYNNVVPVTETVMVGMLDYESDSIIHGNWVDVDGTTSGSSVLMAPFTKGNSTCHAIAFWVDYGIRKEASGNSEESDLFETLSTGFEASSVGQSKSRVSERQTVRILAKERLTKLGESLAIPKHGFEL